MGHFEFSVSALRQKNFVLGLVEKDKLSPRKHSRVSLPPKTQLSYPPSSSSAKIPGNDGIVTGYTKKTQKPEIVRADDRDVGQFGNLAKDTSIYGNSGQASTCCVASLIDMENKPTRQAQSSLDCVETGTKIAPATGHMNKYREHVSSLDCYSSTYSSRTALTPKLGLTESTSRSRTSALVDSKGISRAESRLVSTVITATSFSKLTLTEIKKTDRHGFIYEARQTAGGELYEIRVYSFDGKDPNEKQYLKRNCREWKKRRRFIDSHEENGLIFLILRHPQATTIGSLSSTPLDHSPLSAVLLDTPTVEAKPAPALSPFPSHSFTPENMQLTVPHKNLWSWNSEWNWVYPVGWSRKLVLNDDEGARKGLFLLDFDGGYFSETVPRRIFSPEHLSHPDERRLVHHKKPGNIQKPRSNHSPAVCKSPDLIRRLIEFWFSPDNFRFDTSLRKHMNSSGFIPLSIVACHNKQNS